MKLMGAHAILAHAEQVVSQQPLLQGNAASLEYSADRDSEWLAASAALVEAWTSAFSL